MGDSCEKCGSYRLKPYQGCNGTLYHPAERKGWECLECGHIQAEDDDYESYPNEDDPFI